MKRREKRQAPSCVWVVEASCDYHALESYGFRPWWDLGLQCYGSEGAARSACDSLAKGHSGSSWRFRAQKYVRATKKKGGSKCNLVDAK
jgi:hypothetical protein